MSSTELAAGKLSFNKVSIVEPPSVLYINIEPATVLTLDIEPTTL